MTSPLFADRSDLTALNQAINSNQDQVVLSNKGNPLQHYWSTPERPQDSPIQDTLQVDFAAPSLVNKLSIETVKYPHRITFEYTSDEDETWTPLIDSGLGTPLVITVFDSVPAILPTTTQLIGHSHPQHEYAGHWLPLTLSILPTYIFKLRVILERLNTNSGPKDIRGNALPYSLAIQNLDLLFEVNSSDDIPLNYADPDSNTVSQSFATSSDLFDSVVSFAVRRNKVSNLIDNTDDSAVDIWRSEPQPYPWAVVNVYADVRDDNGDAAIIDRIFIDPLYNGSHISAYYSSEIDTTADFPTCNEPLPASTANVFGNVTFDYNSLTLDNTSFVQINNRRLIDFDPSNPWWVGLEVSSPVDQDTLSSELVIFDCENFQITFDANNFYFRDLDTLDVISVASPFFAGDTITLVAGSNNGRLYLAVSIDDGFEEFDAPTSAAPSSSIPAIITLGADSNQSKNSSLSFYSFVLKQESVVDFSYLTDPGAYSSVSTTSRNTTQSSSNAVLRLDPSVITDGFPTGLVGGPAIYYDNVIWTPIPRDYEAQRGYMELPPTKAMFWKLEITNLQPESVDIVVPIVREVKTFPVQVLNQYRSLSGDQDRANSDDLGTNTQASLANAVGYNDYPLYVGTGGTQSGISNTQVYIAEDHISQKRLNGLGAQWSYRSGHADRTAPRFYQTGKHVYNIESVEQSASVAYFTGFRQVAFFKTSNTTPQNQPQIEEAFLDDSAITSGNWVLEDGYLNSGSASYAQSTSIIIPTSRSIKAVQFASQQTDPVQILPDSEFDDPTHNSWTSSGDAIILAVEESTFDGDNTLIVARPSHTGYWVSTESNYPTWDSMANATYSNLEQDTAGSSELTGGVLSNAIPIPQGGRISAACRVSASDTLEAPLWLQILDASTNTVLAEAPSPSPERGILEWDCGFSVSDVIGKTTGNTWDDLLQQTTYPTFSDAWASKANASTVGNLNTGQAWQTSFSGHLHSIASGAALVAVAGAESYVETQTPWGSLSVTLGNATTTGTHSAAMPLIDLGGVYLMNDGTFVNSNTSAILFTLSHTLTAGHTYTFNIMLTSQVPSGQTTSADPFVCPYSVVISDNGTWFQTYSSTQAFSTHKAIRGALNQTFTAFSWVPVHTQVKVNTLVQSLAQPNFVNMTSPDGINYLWSQTPAIQWEYEGVYTYASNALIPSVVSATSLAPSPYTVYGDIAVRDVFDQTGTLEFNVTTMASGITPSAVSIAYLDRDPVSSREVTLQADGSIFDTLTNSTMKTGLISSFTAGPIQVRYVNPQLLSSGFRSTWAISSAYTQAMIFLQANVVKGVYSGNNIWSSTTRGIGGGQSGTGTGQQTVIEGFGWYPDAALLAPDTTNITWDQVTYSGTRTYSDMQSQTVAGVTSIRVQLIQKDQTSDHWGIESIAIFWNPIVWEFSVNQGLDWFDSLDVRNNANGVLLFPLGLSSYNNLRWRLTSYAPNVNVSHLSIRPWYGGFMRDTPIRPNQLAYGPNISPSDHYTSIDKDPHWKIWNKPIPRSWYLKYH